MNPRIAVVTGASAGIGEAVARDLVAAGFKVVLSARRAHLLESLAASLGGRANALPVPGDAADPATVAAVLDAARDHFGDGKRDADLVVVNAGRGLRGSVYDSDSSQWDEMVRINLLGAAHLLRAAAERMCGPTPTVAGPPRAAPTPPAPPADWPASPRDIVILGSTVGRHVSPFSSIYGATKAAVHMLAESLRRVCAPRGVRVTLLEPGVVKSEFQSVAAYDPASFGAFMDSIAPVLAPDDIARTIRFIVTQPPGVHINDVMIRPTRQEYP